MRALTACADRVPRMSKSIALDAKSGCRPSDLLILENLERGMSKSDVLRAGRILVVVATPE